MARQSMGRGSRGGSSGSGNKGNPAVAVIIVVIVALMWTCNSRRGKRPSPQPTASAPVPTTPEFHTPYTIELPQANQRLGSAVVVLLDTSGSMNDTVRDRNGQMRPKYEIARQALEAILDYTNEWRKSKPDRVLEMGIFRFSSSAMEVQPVGPFDYGQLKAAIGRIPQPGGGTAIGEALEQGFKSLYSTGCTRKYVVCISDGQNTAGNPPDYIARILHAQTGGEVEIHFVAFDTSPAKFGFLSSVNGTVVEAADGAQLQAKLTDIYDKRILAEAPPAEK